MTLAGLVLITCLHHTVRLSNDTQSGISRVMRAYIMHCSYSYIMHAAIIRAGGWAWLIAHRYNVPCTAGKVTACHEALLFEQSAPGYQA